VYALENYHQGQTTVTAAQLQPVAEAISAIHGLYADIEQDEAGGSPITWLLIQLFTWQNIVGFAVIAIIYLAGVLLTWRRARQF
ncbi:hypothetical protein ONO12_27995, partial [Salmonella enterica subsp. enterica serovar Montevideo]|nr:hypothetical protein [Salmonella enterica subsp. enterica serovar Montevideo]